MEDPRLHALISRIDTFRFAYPVDMRQPAKHARIDCDAVAAVLVTHKWVATLSQRIDGSLSLVLAEPIIEEDYKGTLAQAALSAVRAELEVVYDSESPGCDPS
jgi:hypothetical protein